MGPGQAGSEQPDWGAAVVALLERGGRAARRLMAQQARSDGLRIPDPKVMGNAFAQLAQAAMADPGRLAAAQGRLWHSMGELWQHHLRRTGGGEEPPLVEPEAADRRFRDRSWRADPSFALIQQAYLLAGRWLQATVAEVEGLDPATRRQAAFFTRLLVEALSPSNFALTNPVVLRRAAETQGRSLIGGLERLVADLERSEGELRISLTDEQAFTLGGDLAVTPGKVVFQNALMQLIQYAPSTERVHRRPLLIVPPWINKFYILDLAPANSLVRYAVAQGFTLFVISWVNPGPELAETSFERYLEDGPLAALQAIERATGEPEATVLGYCLGGTLTACLLAWLARAGDGRIKAATFLTTLLDFAEPGEIAVFIDDAQLELLERHMRAKGYLEARHMQKVFSLLRANDLIWSAVVKGYLLGQAPAALDLLYWNADGTRMPASMHSFYLRNMYQRNLLVRPGGITLKGAPIDLGAVRTPSYFLSTREDHIAPWASTYQGSRHLGGRVRFVLGGSGHVAGVVNPPGTPRHGYWINPRRPRRAERWLAGAEAHEGSWWPDWSTWLARRSGAMVPARQPGAGGLAVIEDAPGSYVRMRAVD